MAQNINVMQGFNLAKTIDTLIADLNSQEFSINTVNTAKLTMTLMLINTALKFIPRALKLAEFSEKAENRLFDENRVASLNTQQLMDLYRLSIDRVNNSIHFVSAVLNNIKWVELTNALTLITDGKIKMLDDEASRATALEISKAIADLKEKGLVPEVVSAAESGPTVPFTEGEVEVIDDEDEIK